ncbi:MAG TPA: hypothetical protein VJV23_15825, partial [Candidatus Polarisedimenticolia bacterium]|nr:hypothetical protein [Candidatus Polarisedimenticolia bacterium]
MRPPLLLPLLLAAFLILLALGGFLLLKGAGQAEPIDALPSGTGIAVEADDLPRLWRALDRARGGPGRDGEGWWELLARSATAALARRGVPLEAPAEAMEALLEGAAAFGLVPPERGEEGPADLVLAGRPPRAASRTLAEARRTVEGLLPGGLWSERTHRGHRYGIVRPSGSSRPICLAAARGLVLVTTSGSAMRRVIDVLEARAGGLSASPAFRQAAGRISRRAPLRLYASGAWVRGAARPARGAGAAWGRMAGLASVRFAALSLVPRPSGFRERLFVSLDDEGRGLSAALSGAPAAVRRAAQPGPAEPFPFRVTLSVSTLRDLYRALPSIASRAGAPGDLGEKLAGLERFLDLDVERDLLGALGGDLEIWFGGGPALPRGAG